MKFKLLSCASILSLLLVIGCTGANVDTQTSGITVSSAPEATVTPTATETFAPSATIASTHTPTFTLTATATVIPIVQVQVKSEFVIVREGPDEIFGQVATVSAGVILEAVGITVDEAWMLVKIAPKREGWIATNTLEVGEGYQFLPRLEPPPTPTLTPTPEARPTVIVRKYSYVQGERGSYQLIHFVPGEIVTVTITNVANGKLLEKNQENINSEGEANGGFDTRTYQGFVYLTDKGVYKIVAVGNKGSYAEAYFEIIE